MFRSLCARLYQSGCNIHLHSINFPNITRNLETSDFLRNKNGFFTCGVFRGLACTISIYTSATSPCKSHLQAVYVMQKCIWISGSSLTSNNGRGTRFYSSSQYPPHELLTMPALSPTMKMGTLVQWKVKPGDTVAAGTVLADIETDKATLGFETLEDGVVAKLLVEDGSKDIPVGVPVAILVETAEQVQEFANYTVSSASSLKASNAEATVPESAPSASDSASSPAPIARSSKMGPAARMALKNAGLSAESVEPTGPQGIITKGDVLMAIAAGATDPPSKPDISPAASAPLPESSPQQGTTTTQAASSGEVTSPRVQHGEHYTDVPVTNMRRVIAKRLLASKVEIPAIYVTESVRLSPLTSFRKSLKEAGMKASVNDMVIKAVAKALQQVPGACAGWDAAAEEIVRFPKVDISVAVATKGGLVTPIIADADSKNIFEIASAMKSLADRAKENKLAPHEFTGGSFTISNLGMFGVKEFSAIINPPQACILAVGGSQESVALRGEQLVAEPRMSVRLSADNRVVDEPTAAEFLSSFKFHMENPAVLMA